jgi:hypothetical protein
VAKRVNVNKTCIVSLRCLLTHNNKSINIPIKAQQPYYQVHEAQLGSDVDCLVKILMRDDVRMMLMHISIILEAHRGPELDVCFYLIAVSQGTSMLIRQSFPRDL